MLRFLPGPLVGIIAGILYLLNLFLVPTLVILVAIFCYLTPVPWARRKVSYLLHEVIPPLWIDINDFIVWLTTDIEWDIKGKGELRRDHWYFVVCNHQSWVDILLLESLFKRKTPMLKFFLKQELLWMLPFGGLACWFMGFPFMKRHSKAYLKKHPEKINEDVENTRRACEKFKQQPISIINFLEGTRFTKLKHERQNSPYKHLLKPRAGGIALVLSALQGYLNEVIDVTIIYPPNISLWNFMCGKVRKIIIRYEIVPINSQLVGHYYDDIEFRKVFQAWLNERWELKDQLIEREMNNVL